jgi:hypothetical protein
VETVPKQGWEVGKAQELEGQRDSVEKGACERGCAERSVQGLLLTPGSLGVNPEGCSQRPTPGHLFLAMCAPENLIQVYV